MANIFLEKSRRNFSRGALPGFRVGQHDQLAKSSSLRMALPRVKVVLEEVSISNYGDEHLVERCNRSHTLIGLLSTFLKCRIEELQLEMNQPPIVWVPSHLVPKGVSTNIPKLEIIRGRFGYTICWQTNLSLNRSNVGKSDDSELGRSLETAASYLPARSWLWWIVKLIFLIVLNLCFAAAVVFNDLVYAGGRELANWARFEVNDSLYPLALQLPGLLGCVLVLLQKISLWSNREMCKSTRRPKFALLWVFIICIAEASAGIATVVAIDRIFVSKVIQPLFKALSMDTSLFVPFAMAFVTHLVRRCGGCGGGGDDVQTKWSTLIIALVGVIAFGVLPVVCTILIDHPILLVCSIMGLPTALSLFSTRPANYLEQLLGAFFRVVAMVVTLFIMVVPRFGNIEQWQMLFTYRSCMIWVLPLCCLLLFHLLSWPLFQLRTIMTPVLLGLTRYITIVVLTFAVSRNGGVGGITRADIVLSVWASLHCVFLLVTLIIPWCSARFAISGENEMGLVGWEELFGNSPPHLQQPFGWVADLYVSFKRKKSKKSQQPLMISYNAMPTRTLICPCLWHESLDEMRSAIGNLVSVAQDTVVDDLEVHLLFDDSAIGRGKRMENSVYVKNLDIVLKEFNIPTVGFQETSYGVRLITEIVNPTRHLSISFIIHYKSNALVYNRKRWSHVLVICEALSNAPTMNMDPDRLFFFFCDGDTRFSKLSLDLMRADLLNDPDCGAVCGRIFPEGDSTSLILLYQQFEFAVGQWLAKTFEHVFGTVLCCAGPITMVRARALLGPRVRLSNALSSCPLSRYSLLVSTPEELLQYDLGEDRALTSLFIIYGWRTRYNSLAKAYCRSPEDLNGFLVQRRRWLPSTMMNTLLLLQNQASVLRTNNSVSIFFLFYLILNFVLSFLQPATVLLLTFGGWYEAFNGTPFAFVGFITGIAVPVFYWFLCWLLAFEPTQDSASWKAWKQRTTVEGGDFLLLYLRRPTSPWPSWGWCLLWC